MSDEYVEVEERGLGDNLLDSIKGIAVGSILFLVSFPLLWWNEGRTDMSEVARQAKVASATSVDKSLDGKLIAVTGSIKAGSPIGDGKLLKPGDYVELRRIVEMYAWIEHRHSSTEKKLGGGTKETTTYTYDQDWTERPAPASDMKVPDKHSNPPKPMDNAVFHPETASLGAYRFDPGRVELPAAKPLPLDQDMVGPDGGPAPAPTAKPAGVVGGNGAKTLAGPAEDDDPPAAKTKAKHKTKKKHHGRRTRHMVTVREQHPPAPVASSAAAAPLAAGYKLDGNYLFRGHGTADSPQLGDVRISYQALSSGGDEMTLYGQQSGQEVKPFPTGKGDETLYRVLRGGHQQAVAHLASEHKMITWILRLVGFLVMWFGLNLFFGPVNAVLDIVPFLGSAGRFLTGLVLLPISIVLSTLVILLSIVAHSPILLVLTLVAIIGGGFFVYQRKKQQRRPG